MKVLARSILLVLLMLVFRQQGISQQKPNFWDDVQTIKQYDKLFRPLPSPIVFTGSSSIRLWDDLAEMFPGYRVMNRGIGGAVIKDIDRYVEDIILPYKPRQIVLYIGENDIISAPDGDSICRMFKTLFYHIRAVLPGVPIAYISIKASPSREKFIPIAVRANTLISEFLRTEPATVFIDVFYPMLDKNGKMRPELFRTDMLHMKPGGYQIWQELVKPHLVNQ